MKRMILCVCLAVATTGTMAQNTSKNGHQITPEANDWGLGIDVNPLFNYMGNMFNGNTGNSSPSWDYVKNSPVPYTITGYMLKDENTAYRGKIRLGIGSTKLTNYVSDDNDTIAALPNQTVEDTYKASQTNILIGAGIQKMRGKHRVKGYYGAEVELGLMGGKNTYEYGNAMTVLNTSPTSTVESSWTTSSPYSASASSRTTEEKMGSGFYFGVRGFVGVEYFVAPRISVAGEFGWGIGLLSQGEGETTTQTVDFAGTAPAVVSETTKSGKSSFFGADTDSGSAFTQSSGSLRMTFYF